jgi:hypothetical protein
MSSDGAAPGYVIIEEVRYSATQAHGPPKEKVFVLVLDARGLVRNLFFDAGVYHAGTKDRLIREAMARK